MKNLSKILLVVVSVIALVTTAGVLTPRVVKAVTATLVQNVDSPARNAYVGSCYISTGLPNTSCGFNTPIQKEFVIQMVSFTGATNVSVNNIDLSVSTTVGGNKSFWSVEIPKNAVTSAPQIFGTSFPTISSYYLSGTATTLYADPPPTMKPLAINVFVSLNANPEGFDRVAGWVTVSGYTVNVDSSSSSSSL